VEEGANVLGEYEYNPFGQRVRKVAGGATTLYVYDFNGSLIAEADGSGTVQKEDIYRGKGLLAMADASTGAVYRFHNDQLGTPGRWAR
jgi:hypothetical protein